MERQGRSCKQLLDKRNRTRGYWKLKEAALDRAVWRTRFGSLWTFRKTDYGMMKVSDLSGFFLCILYPVLCEKMYTETAHFINDVNIKSVVKAEYLQENMYCPASPV